MALESPQLHRLRIALESTFGIDQTTAGTSFTGFLELPITRGTFRGGRSGEELDRQTAQQFIDHAEEMDIGRRRCEPSFDMLLHSHGVELEGNNSPPDATTWGFARLLKSGIFGGLWTEGAPPSATTQVQAGVTATSIPVTTGHGARFTRGGVIGCMVAGKLEARPILSISTDTISVKIAFSAAPAQGSTVYGGVTFYPTADGTESVQLAYEGKETSQRYGYMGLNGGMTIAIENGQLAQASVSLIGADWLKYGTAALAAATVTNYQSVVVKGSEFLVGTVGSTTLNRVHTATRTWTPNFNWSRAESSFGVEGVIRNRRLHEPPLISGEITPYRDGSGFDFDAAQASKADLAFVQQLGSTPGGTVVLESPTVQVWYPGDSDVNGIEGAPVQWKGRQDTSLSSPTNDLERAAFRVTCL